MRTIFDTKRQVATVWASQTQRTGKVRGGRIFFEHDVIYSYGNHFPIARIIKSKEGKSGALLTTRWYSRTTSGHISVVHRALNDSNFLIFKTKDVMSDRHQDHVDNFRKQAEELLGKAKRAWKYKESYLESAKHWLGLIRQYVDFVGAHNFVKEKLDEGLGVEKPEIVKCNECKEDISKREQQFVRGNWDGDVYCESCYCELFMSCSSCNYAELVNKITTVDEDTNLCGGCYCESYYKECKQCHALWSLENLETFEDFGEICDNCKGKILRLRFKDQLTIKFEDKL
jgi:hypothetical protein